MAKYRTFEDKEKMVALTLAWDGVTTLHVISLGLVDSLLLDVDTTSNRPVDWSLDWMEIYLAHEQDPTPTIRTHYNDTYNRAK